MCHRHISHYVSFLEIRKSQTKPETPAKAEEKSIPVLAINKSSAECAKPSLTATTHINLAIPKSLPITKPSVIPTEVG